MTLALIHIGFGKTGSTSIQRALAADPDALGPVLYPTFGEGPSHNHLVLAYRPFAAIGRGLKNRFADPARRTARIASIRSTLAGVLATGRPLILSGEFLAAMEPAEIAALVADLHAGGITRIVTICYVREPASLFLSITQQSLRYAPNFPDPRTFRFRFREQIDNWRRGTGGAVIVRPFEKDQMVGGDVIADFLAQAGGVFGTTLAAAPAPFANSSLYAESMLLLRDLARARARQGEPERWDEKERRLALVTERSRHHATRLTKPRLRWDIAAMIRENNRDEIDALARDHGIRFPGTEGVGRPPRGAFDGAPLPLGRIFPGYSLYGLLRLRHDVLRRMRREGVRDRAGPRTD